MSHNLATEYPVHSPRIVQGACVAILSRIYRTLLSNHCPYLHTSGVVVAKKLVAGPGFEPGTSAYETDVLPLHYPAIKMLKNKSWSRITGLVTVSTLGRSASSII